MTVYKHYISESTQQGNQYVGGGEGVNDSEEYHMSNIARIVVLKLVTAGQVAKLGGIVSAFNNAAESNAWGADFHIALHSNAGGGDGTVTFFYEGSAQSQRLAQCIQDSVALVSPGADEGIKRGNQFVELNSTRAPAVLCEIAFHDNMIEADHIRNNYEAYAEAIFQGIMKFHGIAVKPPVVKPITPPVEPPVVDVEHYLVRITADVLNVRSGAGVSFPVTTQVKQNQVYTIVDTVNGWGKLISGSGWISLAYTTPENNYKPNLKPVVYAKVSVGNSRLMLRSAATVKSKILARINSGEEVVVISKGVYWSNVVYKGINGYVSTTYLRF